jgi:hypothetical protein
LYEHVPLRLLTSFASANLCKYLHFKKNTRRRLSRKQLNTVPGEAKRILVSSSVNKKSYDGSSPHQLLGQTTILFLSAVLAD